MCTGIGIAILIVLILLGIWAYVNYKRKYLVQAFDREAYRVSAPYSKVESDMLARINAFTIDLLRYLRAKYDGGDELTSRETRITRRLLERYDQNVLQENIPTNIKYTSYVLNKGDEIAFCLKKKEDGSMHEFNDIQFVVLHELAHLGIEHFGHTRLFWATFEFLITEAMQAGLYTPKEYQKHNITYCGVKVTYNPYYDPNSAFKT